MRLRHPVEGTCETIGSAFRGEVGGWGRDPKKCTGRDWGMGSSTIQWNLRPVVKYHLPRGVGFMKFLENGSRPQPPTSPSEALSVGPSASALLGNLLRPTQSLIYGPLLVNRFQQKGILIIVQYKYLKSWSRDFILQNMFLLTKSCGTGVITEPSWLFHFCPIKMVGRKFFVLMYQLRMRILGAPALKYFCMIHKVGRIDNCR